MLSFSTVTRCDRGHVRDVACTRGHEHHLLVQHLVVPEVMQQGHGHDMEVAGHEHGRAWHPDQCRVELVDEGPHRETVPVELVVQHAPATPPGDDGDDERPGNGEREPAAGGYLESIGGEVAKVGQEQEAEDKARQRHAPTPAGGGDQAHKDSVDGHSPGDRDAVGGGQIAR